VSPPPEEDCVLGDSGTSVIHQAIAPSGADWNTSRGKSCRFQPGDGDSTETTTDMMRSPSSRGRPVAAQRRVQGGISFRLIPGTPLVMNNWNSETRQKSQLLDEPETKKNWVFNCTAQISNISTPQPELTSFTSRHSRKGSILPTTRVLSPSLPRTFGKHQP